MIYHYVIKCGHCGKHSVQTLDSNKSIARMIFKCKYCNKSMQARKQRQKFAGLQFKYYGPFNGQGASQFCAQLNGANKEIGFATYNAGGENSV